VGWTIKDSSLSRHCCSDYVKIRSVRIVEVHVIVSHITILCDAQKYFNGFIYVTDNNNTYLGLHVKCSIVVSNFNRLWNFSTRFCKVYQYQISQKYIQWGPCWYLHTDRQTDMKRLVNAFRDYANAPRNLSGLPFLSWHMYFQHESVAVSLNWFHRWYVA
jgi:hypothetical protein